MSVQSPPEDSVLRRHWAQLQQMNAAAPRAAATPAKPRPASVSASPPQASAEGGGIMGWLKRLFGG